jgi:hypothetical protein
MGCLVGHSSARAASVVQSRANVAHPKTRAADIFFMVDFLPRAGASERQQIWGPTIERLMVASYHRTFMRPPRRCGTFTHLQNAGRDLARVSMHERFHDLDIVSTVDIRGVRL